jgi:hypothetical protein
VAVVAKPGKRPFVPSAADRSQVEALVAFGIPEADICRLIVNPATGKPIDCKTLRKHFRDEIDLGLTKAVAVVAGRLMNATKGTSATSVRAQEFFLKTRGRWRTTDNLELSGPGGGPIQSETSELSEEDKAAKLAAIMANAAKRKAATGGDE